MKEIQGNVLGKGKKFAIILSRFNSFISENLLNGALDCLKRHEVSDDSIELIRVPGAFEIPVVAKILAETGKYSALICLGAVIRGSTPHFDYVAGEMAKGIAQVSLKTGLPVAFGVITADTIEQAIERAGTKSGNKGWDASLVALEMANLFDLLK